MHSRTHRGRAACGLLIALLAAGCPDDGSDAGNDTGTDAGTDSGMVMNPDPCDPITQDCVDPAAPVCGVVFEPPMPPMPTIVDTFTCRPSLGMDGPGDPCTRPNGIAGEDTCETGLYCAYFGSPQGTPQERTCHALCDMTAPDCADPNRVCFGMDINGFIGVCALTCDPFNDTCPAGTKCSLYGDSIGGGGLLWMCAFDGPGVEGDPCFDSEECGAGMSCREDGLGNFTCTTLCNSNASCNAGDACELADESTTPVAAFCRSVDYSCVGSVTWPTPMGATANVHIETFAAPDFLSTYNVDIKVCDAADTTCATPLDMANTGMTGTADVTVALGASGFDGYIEASAPGFQTTLIYPAHPITADDSLQIPLTSATISGMSWVGTPPPFDMTRGNVFGEGDACNFNPGGLLSVSIDTMDAMTVVGYYSVANLGMFDAAATETDASGIYAMANVPAGPATLTWTTNGGATVVGTRDINVRADTNTVVFLEPTP